MSGPFAREKSERAHCYFAYSKVSGRGNGRGCYGGERHHAPGHMQCRCDEEVAFPALPVQNLFHFDGAFSRTSQQLTFCQKAHHAKRHFSN